MKRTFLVGGLSIAVLFAASIASLLALTGPAATPPTPESYEPSAPAPPAPPVAAPRLAPGDERQPARARATSGVPAGLPSSAPMADRLTQKAIRKALRAPSVESRLAGCTRVWEFGGTSPADRAPRVEPTSLVLELEARGSELRVVDASVWKWGAASEAALSCVRDVLRSQAIPMVKKRSNAERIRMHFTLYPRGEAIAGR